MLVMSRPAVAVVSEQEVSEQSIVASIGSPTAST